MNTPASSSNHIDLRQAVLQQFRVFLESKNLTKKSVSNYVSDVRGFFQHLGPLFELNTAAFDLISTQILAYRTALLEKATPLSTIHRHLASLKQFSVFLNEVHHAGIQTEISHQTRENHAEKREAPFSSNQKALESFRLALEKERCSPSTIKNYLADTSKFANFLEELPLLGLQTKPKFGEYADYLRVNAVSRATIDRNLAALKKFYRWAFKSNYIKLEFFPSPGAQIREIVKKSFQPLQFFERTRTSRSPGTTRERKSLYQAYTSWPVSSYLHLGVLVLFTGLLSIFGYQQFFRDVQQKLAYPSAFVTPNRILSFQGRLTDTAGTPITVATNHAFRLYDAASSGTLLWNSGTCSITPDSDGVFSTILGETCGSAIAATVFSENANVYLEVQVGSETLTPRQHIATVGYALNAETLQGFPPGTGTSTVPYLDSTGKITIAAASPTLESTSGTFALKGEAITFSTETSSNGAITLSPDGTGSVALIGGTTTQDFLTVTNANLTSGTLVKGTVGNNNTGYKFLSFLGGSSPSEKFSVNALGGIHSVESIRVPVATISATYSGATPLIINGTGGQIFSIANSGNIAATGTLTGLTGLSSSGTITFSGLSTGVVYNSSGVLASEAQLSSSRGGTGADLSAAAQGAVPYFSGTGVMSALAAGTDGFVLKTNGAGANPSWVDPVTLSSSYWQLNNKIISPGNSTHDVAVGGTATSSALFQVFGVSGNATTSGNLVFGGTAATNVIAARKMAGLTIGDSSTGNILFGGGNVGIGTTAPAQALHLYGDNASAVVLRVDNANTGASAHSGLIIASGGPTAGDPYTRYSTVTTAWSTGIDNSDSDSFKISQANTLGTNDFFTVEQTGDVGVGTTAPAALFSVGSSSQFQVNSSGAIAAATGITSSGTIVFSGLSTGALYSNSGTITSEAQLSSARGGTGADLSAAAQGAVPYFSSTGVMSALAAGTSGYVLRANGAAANPSWVDPVTLSSSYWQLNNKVLSPGNTTHDVAVGGTATSSALFQVFGMTGNATSSGNLVFGGTSATNVIAARKKAGLTIGDSETGNIVFSGGNIGIGTTTPNVQFAIGSTSQFQINSSGAIAAATGITSSGTITFSGLSTGALYSNSGVITSEAQLSSARGGTGADLSAAAQGAVPYFSSTGVMSALAAGTSGYVLRANGAAANPSWVDPATLWSSLWQLNNKIVSPAISSYDLAIGGTATSSALFQVFGVSGNATTSGNLVFGGTAATNVIAARKMAGLTIGDSSTGNILFGGGNVGIGTTEPSQIAHIYGASATGLALRIDNATTNTNAHSGLIIASAGPTGGDPYIRYSTITTAWSTGIDNSDSDSFKISQANTLGTNDFFTVEQTGDVGVGTTAPAALFSVGSSSQFQVDTSGNISSTGTTGLTLSGSGADFTFSGTGTHSLVASSGTLSLGSNLSVETDIDIVPSGSSGTNDLGTSGVPWDNLYATSITQNGTTLENTYVNVGGDTMSGALVIGVATNPGLTVNSGGTGYITLGGSSIYDAAGSLTLDSDGAYTVLIDDLWIDGNEIFDGVGTQRIAFDETSNYILLANSNVGIGTTAPSALLHVEGSSGLSGATPVTMLLNSTSNGTWTDESIATQILFNSSDVTGSAGTRGAIKSYADDTTGADFGLAFYTTTAGSGGITEQMRISHDGNVGIGDTTPSYDLDITGGARATTLVRGNNIVIGGDDGDSSCANNADGICGVGNLWLATAGNVYFQPNANNDTGSGQSGFVSLGNGGGLTKGFFQIDGHLGGNAAFTVKRAGAGFDIMAASSSAGTTRFVVADAGNVGIGTSLPTNRLDVITGSTTNSEFHLGELEDEGGYLTSTTDSQAVLSGGGEFVSSSWTARSTTASIMNLASGTVRFYTDASLTDGNTFTPTERFTILSGGNVGIGSTSPAAAFNVVGNMTLSGAMSTNDHSVNGIEDNGGINPNVGFEIDNDASGVPDNWAVSGTNITGGNETTTINQGSVSMQLTSSAASATGLATSTCFPISQGNTYNLYGKSRDNSVVATVQYDLVWYTSLSNCTSQSSETAVTVYGPTDPGNFFTSTGGSSGVIGSGARWARVRITAALDSSETIYFDGVRVLPNALAIYADLAEYYPTLPGQNIEAGDLVSQVMSNDAMVAGKSEAGSPNQDSSVLGIVSTKPAITLGDSENNIENRVPLALSGRVPVKIVTSGFIEKGTALGISQIPGIASPMTKPGFMVAKTLETFRPSATTCAQVSDMNSIVWPEDDGTNPNKPCFQLPDGKYVIKLLGFISHSWYDPDVFLVDGGDIQVTGDVANGFVALNTKTNTQIDRIGAFAETITAKLRAGLAQVEELRSPIIKTDRIQTTQPESKIALRLDPSILEILGRPENSTTEQVVASIDHNGNASFSGQLVASTIHANETTVTSARVESLFAQHANISGEATIAGRLRAGSIIASDIEGLEDTVHNTVETALASAINNGTFTVSDPLDGEELLTSLLAPNDASTEAILAEMNAISGTQLTDTEVLQPKAIIINSFLAVKGFSSFTSAAFRSGFTVGNTLSVTYNSIGLTPQVTETGINDTLYIQPSGNGSVDLLAGVLKINQGGNVEVNGDLFVSDSIYAKSVQTKSVNISFASDESIATASAQPSLIGSLLNLYDEQGRVVGTVSDNGTAKFHAIQAGKFVIAAPQEDLAQIGSNSSSNTIAGTATLPAGQQELTIANTTITPKTLVYLTPQSSTENQVLFVKNKTDGQGFTVGIAAPISQDIQFTYWLIETAQ